MSDKPKLKDPFNKNSKKNDAADSKFVQNEAAALPVGAEQIKVVQQPQPTISNHDNAPAKNIEAIVNTTSKHTPIPTVANQPDMPSKSAELANKLGGLLLNAGRPIPIIVPTGLDDESGSNYVPESHRTGTKAENTSDVKRSIVVDSAPIIESSTFANPKNADKPTSSPIAAPTSSPAQLISRACEIEDIGPLSNHKDAAKAANNVGPSSAPSQLIRRASETEETPPQVDAGKHTVFANGYHEQPGLNLVAQNNLQSADSAPTSAPNTTRSSDKVAASVLPHESFDDGDEDMLKYLEQRQSLIRRREEFAAILMHSYMESISFNIVACREIHASVSNHQLNGLNTRYPGYVFARDEEGNTLFHNANIGSVLNCGVFEELARLVDGSEFGRKALPEIVCRPDTDIVVSILKLVNAPFISSQNDPQIFTVVSVHRDTISAQFASESIVMTGWLFKRHGHNDFKKRYCILTDDMLSYYENENISDSTWKGSLKLAGCGFKVLAVDYGNILFKSQTSFVIQAIERKKREKSAWDISIIFGGGKQTKGNDNLDQVEMEFVAQSEIEAQRWIYTVRALTGHIVPITSITTQKCINIEARAAMLNITNNNCETPLHKLARVCNKNSSDEGKFAVLSCVQWLFANECNPFKKNKSGRTALVAAKMSNNLELSQWIKHFTDRLLPTVDGNHTSEYPVLPPPVRIPGYSYLSFVLYDHKYISASEKGTFLDIKNLHMKMSVLNGRGEAVDATQQIDRPLLHQAKQLFWGHTFHLYIPLETVPEDAYVIFHFSGRPKGSSISLDSSNDGLLMTKHIYRINTSNIHSGFQDIKFTEPAVTQVAGSSRAAPISFDLISKTVLSLSVVITRISL